jgi:hypothetical protein
MLRLDTLKYAQNRLAALFASIIRVSRVFLYRLFSSQTLTLHSAPSCDSTYRIRVYHGRGFFLLFTSFQTHIEKSAEQLLAHSSNQPRHPSQCPS